MQLSGLWAIKPPSPWHQRSLPGDGCPFTLMAHGCVVVHSSSFGHPMRASCDPLSTPGSSGLADRGVLGETCCFKGIFVQSNCSFGLAKPSRRTLRCLH